MTRPSDRAIRWLCIASAAAILGVAVALVIQRNVWRAYPGHGGEDFGIYVRHTREWIAGGSFHDARRLTRKSLHTQRGDSLYPPHKFALADAAVPHPISAGSAL